MIDRLLISVMKPMPELTGDNYSILGIDISNNYSTIWGGLHNEQGMKSCFDEGGRLGSFGTGKGAGLDQKDPNKLAYFIGDSRAYYHDTKLLMKKVMDDVIRRDIDELTDCIQ